MSRWMRWPCRILAGVSSWQGLFAAVAAAAVAHRVAVIGIWAVAVMVGIGAARLLPGAVVSGSGAIPGSASARVERTLEQDFKAPYVDPLLVAVAGAPDRVADADFQSWIAAATAQLRRVPGVRAVAGDALVIDRVPGEQALHRALLLVDLHSMGAAERERMVPVLRDALGGLRARMRSIDPDAQLAVTGQAAIAVDINLANKLQGEAAERYALPVTLLLLVVIFGAVGAAGLPLVMGVCSTAIALGIAWAIAQTMAVSNLLENIVTMLGLSLGIDYSLLIVNRLRERSAGSSRGEALVAVMAEEGATVALSAAIVVVGLSGLLFSPLLEMRSLGLGGIVVVSVAALAALTLLPALISLLGAGMEWPRPLSRRFTGARERRFWSVLSARVVNRPVATLLFAVAMAGALAMPALAVRIGFDSDPRALPRGMESRLGLEVIAALNRANSSLPINLVVTAGDGPSALDSSRVPVLMDFAARLAGDARIAAVLSPFVPGAGVAQEFVSRDARAVLFRVIAHDSLSLAAVQAMAKEFSRIDLGPGFGLAAGGPAVYLDDYEAAMAHGMRGALVFVVVGTALLLFFAFRSILLPLKAVLGNLLAVAAGFGAVVAVFQFGWGASWLGIEHQFSAIPLVVPLLLFCLSFGLSMDYEVFLLRDIQRHYLECRDNSVATIRGMVGTGPVISGAAAIMACVFAAFAGVDSAILKMIGFGLTVTVVVDALLIRTLLVPSIMCLAGRWNWLPGVGGNPGN